MSQHPSLTLSKSCSRVCTNFLLLHYLIFYWFIDLNTPKTSYHAIRPHGIINVLSSPQPTDSSGNFRPSSSLFSSREHQDAQELFQLVSELIKNEMVAVDREGLRDRGIAGVLDIGPPNPSSSQGQDEANEALKNNNKSVFEGLTANRRSCMSCMYTEAVMHFGFDNWQLAVPRLAVSERLTYSMFWGLKCFH